FTATAQSGTVRGQVIGAGAPLPHVSVSIPSLGINTASDTSGHYELTDIPYGTYRLVASCIGCEPYRSEIHIDQNTPLVVPIAINVLESALDEVVVTGTMKEISRLESPVPVEIITPTLFRKNPTPS